MIRESRGATAAEARRLTDVESRAYVNALGNRRGGVGSLWKSPLSRKRPAERAAIVRSRHLPVVALHLAAQSVQRMVRGHQVRLLVSYATSNEPALRHRAPRACRVAGMAAAERLKQKRPRALATQAVASPKLRDSGEGGNLAEEEIGLISRYLEARMSSRSEEASQLTFNDWVLQRLQAWGRMLPWRAYLRAMRRPLLRLGAMSIQRR